MVPLYLAISGELGGDQQMTPDVFQRLMMSLLLLVTGLRANYVDVMNPGGKSQSAPTVPAPDLFPSLSYPTQPAKLFMPPPGMFLLSASRGV